VRAAVEIEESTVGIPPRSKPHEPRRGIASVDRDEQLDEPKLDGQSETAGSTSFDFFDD
jgi:hypothetical protein